MVEPRFIFCATFGIYEKILNTQFIFHSTTLISVLSHRTNEAPVAYCIYSYLLPRLDVNFLG
jgi:hypothetical protein